METTEIDGNYGTTARSFVIQINTVEEVTTRQENPMQTAGNVQKSLSPLINSMRLFGLYFSREPRMNSSTTSRLNQEGNRRCQRWNLARIYATVMLVVIWLNSFRNFVIFDVEETLKVELLVKICILSYVLFVALLVTAYYVASHTGSLDRVFHQVNLSAAEISPKYSRRAKVVTVICWSLLVLDFLYYIYPVFTNGQFNDLSTLILFHKLRMSKPYEDIAKVVFAVLDIQYLASYVFPQAMSYIVVSLLCDQFNKLNEEFSKCIGGQGEFNGNFEQFRRRHQAISHSVKEADRFLMISNVACFCCHIIGIIVIIFCIIFYRQYTASYSVEVASQHIFWLVFNMFGLTIAAGMAIFVNNVVSIYYDYSSGRFKGKDKGNGEGLVLATL